MDTADERRQLAALRMAYALHLARAGAGRLGWLEAAIDRQARRLQGLTEATEPSQYADMPLMA